MIAKKQCLFKGEVIDSDNAFGCVLNENSGVTAAGENSGID